MSIVLFYYFLILIFLVTSVTATMLAFAHIYYGSKDIRNIRSGDYISPFFSEHNVKVLHTALGTDSAFVLALSSLIVMSSFLFFLFETLVVNAFTPLFYYYIILMVLLNGALVVKVSRDFLFNRISGIRYELKSMSSGKPDLDFVPDVMFRPLRLLISKNITPGGLTRVGFVNAKRKFIRKSGTTIEFRETIQIRNQSLTLPRNIVKLSVTAPSINIVSIEPELPLTVEPSGLVGISVVYSMAITMKRGLMEVRIICE